MVSVLGPGTLSLIPRLMFLHGIVPFVQAIYLCFVLCIKYVRITAVIVIMNVPKMSIYLLIEGL